MMLSNEQRRIVEENLRLVPFVMNKLRNAIIASGLGMEDARQIGYEALCKAAARWDPERGAKLSTYATLYIRGFILTACNENSLVPVNREALRKHPELRTTVLSLQAPLSADSDDSQTLEDLLPGSGDAGLQTETVDVWELFTAREQRILSLILEGHTKTSASRALGVSPQAVYQVMERVKRKATRYYVQCTG